MPQLGNPEIRPVSPDRQTKVGHDSGVLVGVGTDDESSLPTVPETSTAQPGTRDDSPTRSTSSDPYKTQFIKVYQDAGVVGLSMLTLIVLCVTLGWFCIRLLKMYVALTEGRDKLESARSVALERLTTTVLTNQSQGLKDIDDFKEELRGERRGRDDQLRETRTALDEVLRIVRSLDRRRPE